MKCQESECQRKAVIKYSDEPTFALTHNFGILHICRQCFIKKIQKHMKNCREQLREQKRLCVIEHGGEPQ